jgi:hypothetical protein
MNNSMSKLDVKALGKALMVTGGILIVVPVLSWLITNANPAVLAGIMVVAMVFFFYNIIKD